MVYLYSTKSAKQTSAMHAEYLDKDLKKMNKTPRETFIRLLKYVYFNS